MNLGSPHKVAQRKRMEQTMLSAIDSVLTHFFVSRDGAFPLAEGLPEKVFKYYDCFEDKSEAM